jgi:hypothetical protein
MGTEFTIAGTGFGTIKGKVYLGGTPVKVITWNDDLIHCLINKSSLSPSTYDVTIRPKGAAEIVLQNAFSIRLPEIVSINPSHGGEEIEVTIQGNFFGTKKGKVNLGEKNCKIISWAMNPSTGESEIVIKVPKGLAPGTYDLKISNQMGADTSEGGFAIP